MNQSKDEKYWHQERQKLIQKIIESREEHQKSILQLKNKTREYDNLLSEKSNTEKLHLQQINNLTTQFEALKTETGNWKTERSNNEAEIDSLSHENRMLKARIKQLESSQQQTQQTSIADEPDEYQMEKIVDHKKKKGVMQFRVRWMNYTKNDDTWENEADLMCALCEYKKKMNLN